METRYKIQSFFFIAFGSALVAIGLNVFINANELFSGGLLGIAGMINRFFPQIPFSVLLILLNLPLFIWAWLELNRSFVLLTTTAMVMQAGFLELLKFLPPYTNDVLLASISGAALIGLGFGIVLMNQGSSGGLDIVSLILKKRYGFSVGTSLTIFNFIIVGVIMLFFGLEKGLYTLVATYITGQVVNMTTNGISRKRSALIVTTRGKEIGQELILLLQRGVTMIPGTGIYSNQEKQVLFCVVNVLEITRLKKIVLDIDPQAFITVYETAEVKGLFHRHHPLVDRTEP